MALFPAPAIMCVALRKESVDRNDPDGILVFCGPQSLSARRAWIEILADGIENLS